METLLDPKLGLGIRGRSNIDHLHSNPDLCLRPGHSIYRNSLFPFLDILTRIQIGAFLIQREFPSSIWKTESLAPEPDFVLNIWVSNDPELDIKPDLIPRSKPFFGPPLPIACPQINDLNNNRIGMTALTVRAHSVGCDIVKLSRTVAPLAVPYLDGVGMGNCVIMAMVTSRRVEDIPPCIVVGVGGC